MMTTVALDDEKPALEIIETFAEQSSLIRLEATFTSTVAAKKFLEDNSVDLLLLDIQMPAISGIDFVKVLENPPLVIFTTSYSEYAVEGFNLDAIDYLLKPFTMKRFNQAMDKAWELFQARQQSNPLVFKVNYGLMSVLPEDIQYLEGLDNYIKIHLKDRSPLVVRMTMKEMEEKLSAEQFVRIHRSFIVALDKITFVKNKTIFIDDQSIPLGGKYEPEFFEKYGSGLN